MRVHVDAHVQPPRTYHSYWIRQDLVTKVGISEEAHFRFESLLDHPHAAEILTVDSVVVGDVDTSRDNARDVHLPAHAPRYRVVDLRSRHQAVGVDHFVGHLLQTIE